jgi:hypothetical protein
MAHPFGCCISNSDLRTRLPNVLLCKLGDTHSGVLCNGSTTSQMSKGPGLNALKENREGRGCLWGPALRWRGREMSMLYLGYTLPTP